MWFGPAFFSRPHTLYKWWHHLKQNQNSFSSSIEHQENTLNSNEIVRSKYVCIHTRSLFIKCFQLNLSNILLNSYRATSLTVSAITWLFFIAIIGLFSASCQTPWSGRFAFTFWYAIHLSKSGFVQWNAKYDSVRIFSMPEMHQIPWISTMVY